MATYIVSPTASASGTGSLASPWRLSTARRNAAPGDEVQLRGGTYSGSNNSFDNSDGGGSSGVGDSSRITYTNYQSESPELRDPVRLGNLAYLTFENIRFVSANRDTIMSSTSDGCDRIIFSGCYFNAIGTPDTYIGILMRNCTYVQFTGCEFADWFSGDFLVLQDCSRMMFDQNEMPQARGGHSVISFKDVSRSVVHRNWFRNPLDRAVTIRNDNVGGGEGVVFQWNVCIDSDWNRIDSHPSEPAERGSNQSIRFVCRRGIFRYNAVLKTNLGKDQPQNSCLDVQYFNRSKDGRQGRYYNNVVWDGTNHGINISVNENAVADFRDEDCRFKNNIIGDVEAYCLHMSKTELRWRTYRFFSNMFADTSKSRTIYIAGGGGARTVAEAQSNYPEVFKRNSSGYPTFVDPSIITQVNADPTSYGVANIDEVFEAMQLASGSDGEGEGEELTTVRTSGSSRTVIDVEDARWFTTGWDLVERDQLVVGSEEVELLEVLSDTQIRVDRAIDVTAGDPIYPKVLGSASPNMGLPVIGTGGETPVVPPPEPFFGPLNMGPAPGAVLFDVQGDDPDPFGTDKFVRDKEAGGDFAVTHTIVDIGGYDVVRCRIFPYSAADNYRSEIGRREGTLSKFVDDSVGDERIYECAYWIPSEWANDTDDKLILWQMHGRRDPGEINRGPNLSVQYWDGDLVVRQRSSSNFVDTSNPPGSNIYEQPWSTNVGFGRWWYLRVEAKWHYDTSQDPYLRIYHGADYRNLVQIVDQQPGEAPNCFNDATGPYVKVGAYRPGTPQPNDSSTYVWRLRVTGPPFDDPPDEPDIISEPPTPTPIPPSTSLPQARFISANPILQKQASPLYLGGTSDFAPVMSGLAARMTLNLNPGERLLSWRIYTEDGFEYQVPYADDTEPTADIVFGTNTDTSTAGKRNYIEWITTEGVTTRQVWVKNPPTSGGFYIQNQESQAAAAIFTVGAGEPLSLGINILPNFSDEFFRIGEASENRWTNTLRNWGGALTAEVFLDEVNIIPEQYIGDVDGYYWASPNIGTSPVKIRLRASPGSSFFVDLDGNIQVGLG